MHLLRRMLASLNSVNIICINYKGGTGWCLARSVDTLAIRPNSSRIHKWKYLVVPILKALISVRYRRPIPLISANDIIGEL